MTYEELDQKKLKEIRERALSASFSELVQDRVWLLEYLDRIQLKSGSEKIA